MKNIFENAIERSVEINEGESYNSISLIFEMIENFVANSKVVLYDMRSSCDKMVLVDFTNINSNDYFQLETQDITLYPNTYELSFLFNIINNEIFKNEWGVLSIHSLNIEQGTVKCRFDYVGLDNANKYNKVKENEKGYEIKYIV